MECFYINIQAHIAKKQGDLKTAKGSIGCVILLDFLAFFSLVIGICALPFIILGVVVRGRNSNDAVNADDQDFDTD